MYFKSTFIDTIIVIEVSPGVLEVRSDNLSAITIIKDHVSSEASNRKIQFNIESKMNEEDSVVHVLEKLHPLVETQYNIAKNA